MTQQTTSTRPAVGTVVSTHRYNMWEVENHVAEVVDLATGIVHNVKLNSHYEDAACTADCRIEVGLSEEAQVVYDDFKFEEMARGIVDRSILECEYHVAGRQAVVSRGRKVAKGTTGTIVRTFEGDYGMRTLLRTADGDVWVASANVDIVDPGDYVTTLEEARTMLLDDGASQNPVTTRVKARRLVAAAQAETPEKATEAGEEAPAAEQVADQTQVAGSDDLCKCFGEYVCVGCRLTRPTPSLVQVVADEEKALREEIAKLGRMTEYALTLSNLASLRRYATRLLIQVEDLVDLAGKMK